MTEVNDNTRAPDASPSAGASRREKTSDQQGGEPHHRDVSGGRLRPAVFGAMDGLVTNASLIAGVGGGGGASHTIVLTGLAGLVAGAFSMATGEYTSVRSQNELVESEVAVEKEALASNPDEERRELAASLVRRGVEARLADEVAGQISKSPSAALDFHTQEELGVDPHQLPSPYEAAGSSFVSFGVGAAVPLLPYFFGAPKLWLALLLTAIVLAISGGVVAVLTGRNIFRGAGRQLALAVLAAGVTYAVGRAIGSRVS